MALPDPAALPADVASTTTTDGVTVPFLVRVESGTINRAIYRIAILDNPARPQGSGWKPGPAWNQKLVYAFGGGCGDGFNQGASSPADALVLPALSRGYVVAASSLTAPGTACNDVLGAETVELIKAYIITHYGSLKYTIGWGCSGGGFMQYLLAQNYPGLLDGIIPECATTDSITANPPVLDCGMLNSYFNSTSVAWSAAQRLAVEGAASPAVCQTLLGFSALITPSDCAAAVPASTVYNPVTNPTGTRCTLVDDLVNLFGRDPATGKPLSWFDNEGVQYGLDALLSGVIDAQQFLNLNQYIGGFDSNGAHTPQRVTADDTAVAEAYQRGRVVSGSNLSLPMIDLRAYTDDAGNLPGGGGAAIHTRSATEVTRARLLATRGNLDNWIQLLTPPRSFAPGTSTPEPPALYEGIALDAMGQWLDSLYADKSHRPYAEKVVADKPVSLMSGCWDPTGTFHPDPKIGAGSVCDTIYPILNVESRIAAGEPQTADILKCELKPITASQYPGLLTTAQLAQLATIFPNGVCNYAVPGVGQQPFQQTWLSYQNPLHVHPIQPPTEPAGLVSRLSNR